MSESDLFVEKSLELETGTISYLEAGNGPTVVCLHHSWGSVGAIRLHELLAQSYRLIVPDMPGWGASERPLWARDVRDISILCGHFINQLDTPQVHLIGFGFGGYVAAELAVMNSQILDSLTLIGAPGLFPREGEILDQMMFSHRQYVKESFVDEATFIEQFGEEPSQAIRDVWDHSREMTARVAWKPYFFNRRLEPMLANLKTNTLLIWGASDKVVPRSVAEQYLEQLPRANLHVLPNAGHLVELEWPEKVETLISEHINLNI